MTYVRKFPAYTLAQLKGWLASDRAMADMTPALHASIAAEVAAREAGASQPRVVPQLGAPS